MIYDVYCNDCKEIFKSDIINTCCPTCKNYNTHLYHKEVDDEDELVEVNSCKTCKYKGTHWREQPCVKCSVSFLSQWEEIK